MQDLGYELRRIHLPRTPVNKVLQRAGVAKPPALCSALQRLVESDLTHYSRAAPAQIVEFASLAHLQVDGPL